MALFPYRFSRRSNAGEERKRTPVKDNALRPVDLSAFLRVGMGRCTRRAFHPQKERKLSKDRDRTVYRRSDGKWVNKRNDADRAGSLHDRQSDAQDAARSMLRRSGGGELTTKGRDGKIRSKDTIEPGNDPNPPKDREH